MKHLVALILLIGMVIAPIVIIGCFFREIWWPDDPLTMKIALTALLYFAVSCVIAAMTHKWFAAKK